MNGAARALMALAEDDEQRMAWGWLLHQERIMPPHETPHPLTPPDRPAKPKAIVVCQLFYSEHDEYDCPIPTHLITYDGVELCRIDLATLPGSPLPLTERLFSRLNRGKLLTFLGGSRLAFHVLIRTYGPSLMAAGYSLQPLSTSTSIRALIVRKGKQRWTLTDAGVMTGLDDLDDSTTLREIRGDTSDSGVPLTALYTAIVALQDWLLTRFDAPLSCTLPGTSVRATRSHLASDGWLWPPTRLLEVLCRQGGGFRGGIAWSRPYAGEGWQVDLNRAYTWALSQPLPVRWGIGPGVINGVERPGIYLYDVCGHAASPVYTPVWRGPKRGFVAGYWRGGRALMVLPSVECAGLRALGLSARATGGMVALSYTSLGRFTDALTRVTGDYGRGHALDRVAKHLANTLYGKFAASPKRQERVYSTAAPGRNYQPAITPWGAELPDVWEGESVSYTASQHIDLAAWITGLVRSKVYAAMGALFRNGVPVTSAYVDSIVTTADPSKALQCSSGRLGEWRLVDHSTDVVVCADRAWRFGANVKVPGSQVAEAGVIDELYLTGEAKIAERRLVAPWMGEAMWVETSRVLRSPVPTHGG